MPVPSSSAQPGPSPKGRAPDAGSASAQTAAAARGQQGQQQHSGEEQEGEAQKACSHCGTGSPRCWYRHPVTRERLCDACGSYMRRNGGQERPVGVRCLLCGSDSPGSGIGRHAAWRPHPTSGQRWVCSPCFFGRAGRRCLECSADSPGRAGNNWRRHPVSGAKWLCKRCYERARRQWKCCATSCSWRCWPRFRNKMWHSSMASAS